MRDGSASRPAHSREYDMTHSDLQDPILYAKRDSISLPAKTWHPQDSASIRIHWQPISTGGFEVVLQLIDRALLEDGNRGFIVRAMVGPDQERLPFLLHTANDLTPILRGRFEYRPEKDPAPALDPSNKPAAELWLLDAEYPGGYTDAAKIA